MGKDRSNALVLSSKKAACRLRGDQGREVEKLQIALEAERSKTKQLRRKFAVELRRLKETAEVEHEKAVQQLTSRFERQKALELLRLREVLVKEREAEIRQLLRLKGQELRVVGGGLEKERQAAVRQARELQRRLAQELLGKCASGHRDGEPGCLSNTASYWRLEQLLHRLCREAHGNQAPLVQRLRQELEAEKSFFLRHLLQTHGLEAKHSGGRQRSLSCGPLDVEPSCTHRDPSCIGCSVSRSKSFSHKSRSTSPVVKSGPGVELWNLPPGKELCQAFHCSSPIPSPESHSSSSVGGELGSGMLQNSVTVSAILEQSPQLQHSLLEMEHMCYPKR